MNYTSKKWLLVPLFMGITQCGFAQGSVKSLIVSLNNPIDSKKEMVFALSETPKYWTQGENLVVESTSFKGEVALSNVINITFAKATPTADVPPTIGESVALFPNPATEYIQIRGIGQVHTIQLTDLSGKQIAIAPSSGQDMVTINVSALPTATYLLNIDGQTFKFVKR